MRSPSEVKLGLALTLDCSNNILQHIAEFHHDRGSSNPKPFGNHRPSCSTTTLTDTSEEVTNAQKVYDKIEAEIDVLKQDVWKLRQNSEKGRTAPKTEDELASDRFLYTRSSTRTSHIPAVEESAAVRLQRLHETQDVQRCGQRFQSNTSLPPSAMDFPDLSRSSTTNPRESVTTGQPRRPSYAHAAANGMMDAIGSTFAPHCESAIRGKVSTDTTATTFPVNDPEGSSNLDLLLTNSTGSTQDTFDGTVYDNLTVVSTSSNGLGRTSSTAPSLIVNEHASGTDKTAKYVPHFAQPTKAFTRRAGELHSKDPLSSPSSKLPKDASPHKTIKSKELAVSTAKRFSQSQQKRKSLPAAWIPATDTGLERPVHAATTKPLVSKTAGVKESQAYSPPRKQKPAYMAPTAAAVQRNLATLGPVKQCLEEPKPEDKVLGQHMRTTPALPPGPRSDAEPSETSSVCFILDQPNGACSSSASDSGLSIATASRNVSSIDSPHKISEGWLYSAPTVAPMQAALQAPSHAVTNEIALKTSEVLADDQKSPLKTYASVARIANTTTKRRTSHGHLLVPIVARLASQGLLSNNGQQVRVDGVYVSTIEPDTCHALQRGDGHSIAGLDSQLTGLGISHGTTATGVLPPHLRRSRETSTGSTSTSVTFSRPPATPVAIKHQMLRTEPSVIEERRDSVLDLTVPAIIPADASTRPEAMRRVLSLRPTAEVFCPRQALEDITATDDIELSSKFVPDEEWFQLSPRRRERIQHLRAARGSRGWSTVPKQRMLLDGFSPVSDSSSFGSSNSIWQGQHDAPLCESQQTYQNKKFAGVQAGPVLTPLITPLEKDMTWKLTNPDGRIIPVKFGRAPPPTFGPSTPTVSSRSDDTSPLTASRPTPGWRIGSTYTAIPYGWKGGDGKEISFLGHGPHAERTFNQPIAFDFKGINSRHAPVVSSGFSGEDKENDPHPDFVVPRSQRQWAEKLGYSKLPCGKVEIMDAVESMPFNSQLPAYCFDCVGR